MQASNGITLLPHTSSSPVANEGQGLQRRGLGEPSLSEIENTANTLPTIIRRQIDNVALQGDTTLNFFVDSVAIPVSTVYLDSVEQYIRGFGGANILNWRPAMTAAKYRRRSEPAKVNWVFDSPSSDTL